MIIADFTYQFLEINRELLGAFKSIMDSGQWNDPVAQSYYDNFIHAITDRVEDCLDGQGVYGYGIRDLVIKLDDYAVKMQELSGESFIVIPNTEESGRYPSALGTIDQPDEIYKSNGEDVYDYQHRKNPHYIKDDECQSGNVDLGKIEEIERLRNKTDFLPRNDLF